MAKLSIWKWQNCHLKVAKLSIWKWQNCQFESGKNCQFESCKIVNLKVAKLSIWKWQKSSFEIGQFNWIYDLFLGNYNFLNKVHFHHNFPCEVKKFEHANFHYITSVKKLHSFWPFCPFNIYYNYIHFLLQQRTGNWGKKGELFSIWSLYALKDYSIDKAVIVLQKKKLLFPPST